ncbi:MAG: YqjD family protein [Steroidobacteraceae bacterium]
MESVSDAARNGGNFANGEITKFLENVEELTKALKDVDAPDIARIRAKVKIALLAARGAVADSAVQLRAQAQQVGKRTDSLVRENPWAVVGVAALVGLAVGIFASRRED